MMKQPSSISTRHRYAPKPYACASGLELTYPTNYRFTSLLPCRYSVNSCIRLHRLTKQASSANAYSFVSRRSRMHLCQYGTDFLTVPTPKKKASQNMLTHASRCLSLYTPLNKMNFRSDSFFIIYELQQYSLMLLYIYR